MKFCRQTLSAALAAALLCAPAFSVSAGTPKTGGAGLQASSTDRNEVIYRKVRKPICQPCEAAQPVMSETGQQIECCPIPD